MREKLKGYKTYIVVVAMILYAVIVLGWQGGDWAAAGRTVLEALGLAGIRNAI
jgi:hypothetical protein